MSELSNIVNGAMNQWIRDDGGIMFYDEENPSSVSFYRIAKGQVAWILAEGTSSDSTCHVTIFNVDFSDQTGLVPVYQHQTEGFAAARRTAEGALGI